MAKSKTVFVCNECGNESTKWLGKCPACNSWNSFFEQKVVESKNRTSTGFGELDNVLGGGLVKGSLVLLRRRTRNWKVYTNSSNL